MGTLGIGCLLVLLLIAGAWLLYPIIAPQPPYNSVTWLAKSYNVSEEKVVSVANALGVPPGEMAVYGEGTFPFNYIAEQIEAQRGKLTKVEVDAIVKGYEVRCELDPGQVYYLFYSRNITTSLFRPNEEVALVIEFLYQPSPDGSSRILDRYRLVNIVDSPFECERPKIQRHCLQEPVGNSP